VVPPTFTISGALFPDGYNCDRAIRLPVNGGCPALTNGSFERSPEQLGRELPAVSIERGSQSMPWLSCQLSPYYFPPSWLITGFSLVHIIMPKRKGLSRPNSN